MRQERVGTTRECGKNQHSRGFGRLCFLRPLVEVILLFRLSLVLLVPRLSSTFYPLCRRVWPSNRSNRGKLLTVAPCRLALRVPIPLGHVFEYCLAPSSNRSLAKQEIRNQEQSVRKERGHQAYSITSEPGGAEMFCAVMRLVLSSVAGTHDISCSCKTTS